MLTRAHALGTPLRIPWTAAPERHALARAYGRAGFSAEAVRPSSGAAVTLRSRTWCGTWPRGSVWLRPLYQSGSEANVERFRNAYVDRRIDYFIHGPLDEQPGWWNALDHTVLERWSPIVPLWYRGLAMAHGSAIRGMADDTTLGMPAWSALWVSR
jgi:hypothetical protein